MDWLIGKQSSETDGIKEEPKPQPAQKLHQQFESYKDQVKKMGEETKPAQDLKSEAPTCGICHKTKFADGCGHLCSYCQTKFCARCGGRVSLRSNKMVLSNNSGSRLASDSGGIGRGALEGATEAMPAIYLMVPQAPGPGRLLTMKTGDADMVTTVAREILFCETPLNIYKSLCLRPLECGHSMHRLGRKWLSVTISAQRKAVQPAVCVAALLLCVGLWSWTRRICNELSSTQGAQRNACSGAGKQRDADSRRYILRTRKRRFFGTVIPFNGTMGALQVCNFQSEEITDIRQLGASRGGCNVVVVCEIPHISVQAPCRDQPVMWVCNLCRKQQEILTKSGAWFYGPEPGQVRGVFEGGPQGKKAKLQDPSLYPYQGAPGDLTPGSDRSRPHGGLLPRQASLDNGSGLRKRSPSASRDPNQKYDQGEGGDHSQYAPTDGGMPRSPSDYGDGDPRRAPRGPHMYPDADAARMGYRDRRGPGRWHSQEYPLDQELDGPSEYDLQRQRQEEFQTRYRSDPNLARYPVKPQPYEEQMRMHAEVGRMRHERRHSDVSLAYTEQDDPGPVRLSRQHLTERRPPMVGQRSYSVDRSSPGPMGGSLGGHRSSNHSPPTPHRSPVLGDRSGDLRRGDMDSMRRQQHHLDPSSAVRKTKREKMESMLRNDSLSSDQSESVRPPPPKPHKTKKGGKMRQVSLSSSEEELATTPEYTSCEDVEIESESVSEKGDSQRGKRKTIEQTFMSEPTHTLSERQKKMVRFGGHSFEEDLAWCEPQVKDSGVDTCSSTTLNEEHSHSEKHPVTWQPSKDGDRLIGRILLNKRMKDGSVPRDSGALLGLKVVGGKMTESGRLCAFITKVRKGSLADTVGHLRPGDQVLEWNGKLLQGATFKEVYNIILDSKPEPQVELVVSRPIGDIPRIPDSTHAQLESSSSSFESQKVDRPSISVTSPMSPSMLRDAPQYLSGQLSSQSLSRRTTPFTPRVQVKLWYDKVGHQLIVTILGAKDLPPREDGRPRNPYVKIYFLPDRSDKSKRRTKTVKKSLEPKWNQTFMYSPVHRREFRERMLEITLWDQARVREEESEFLGEILIELETALLDDEPHWYKLQTHDVSSMPLPRASPNTQRRQLHGESPTRRLQNKGSYSYNSGSQRISDSEISDYDCEDGVGVITDYRSNGRDFQSSTLSVPDQVMSSNHCSHSADINRARSRSPSVPPPSSRSLDPAFDLRPSQYSSSTRVDHHSVSEDNYSPDSRNHRVYPICREEAVRLLRSTRMARAHSEGAYSSDYDYERY
ncbi:hypothetical protein JOQ06_024836 [Pogonophryne albipinna]|uniref:Regulating synaptic membrane exocytosis protein 2 n=1 Tax=Pogonophryne albipinna TaxID=1090488 RepID=A0AAD6ATN3_9TELE|nr:hypothetical protein JOQ06_024836 [Pogonophryne albipinna]